MPLGAYPQDLLWGQVGSAPTRIKTSTTSNTVEMVIEALLSVEVETYHDFILIRPERLCYGVNTSCPSFGEK